MNAFDTNVFPRRINRTTDFMMLNTFLFFFGIFFLNSKQDCDDQLSGKDISLNLFPNE